MEAPASAAERAFSVVVLGITPTRLPARSFTVPMPESVVASRLPPSTEIMWLNATCSMRPKVIVVDPHSRSIVPLTSFALRSAGVIATDPRVVARVNAKIFNAASLEFMHGLRALRWETGGAERQRLVYRSGSQECQP